MAGGTRVNTVYTSTALAAVVSLCVGINVGIFIARKPEAKCPKLVQHPCPACSACPTCPNCPLCPVCPVHKPSGIVLGRKSVGGDSEPKIFPWDWDRTAEYATAHWGIGSITPAMLDKAAKRVERAGVAFRAQIINQRLYIEDIKALWFLRDYTPSRIQMLVEVLKRHKVPDLEAIFNSGDYPVMLVPRNPKHMTDLYDDLKPPPIFSPTANIISFDLPWPDFSFLPPPGKHELGTPRWDEARQNIISAAEKIRWEEKIDLAVMTGNMQAEPRQKLVEVAKEHTDSIFVNEIFIKTPTGRKNCIEEGLAKRGGHQKDACGIPFEDLCRFKYLINVGSNGYANKLKYLFLCKSVVIFVRKGAPNWEFFEHQFMPGRDYISVPTPEDVPAAISMLRRNEAYAQEVASQGTARMTQMDLEEITRYGAAVLTKYSKLMGFTPTPRPGAWEVNCEDDLYRHYNRDGHLLQWAVGNNDTCISKPKPEEIVYPGWGGAYKGSGVTCEAANDLYEVPRICDDNERHPGDHLELYGKTKVKGPHGV